MAKVDKNVWYCTVCGRTFDRELGWQPPEMSHCSYLMMVANVFWHEPDAPDPDPLGVLMFDPSDPDPLVLELLDRSK